MRNLQIDILRKQETNIWKQVKVMNRQITEVSMQIINM